MYSFKICLPKKEGKIFNRIINPLGVLVIELESIPGEKFGTKPLSSLCQSLKSFFYFVRLPLGVVPMVGPLETV